MLRVPRPRVEIVRRSVAGRASPGDHAVVRVEPGLLSLLEHPIAGLSTGLGTGYHGRYTLPIGLSISAALALVEPATPEESAWVGREATLEWLAVPALDAMLRGEARLVAQSERDAVLSISAGSEGGPALLRGELLLVRVAHGRPVGYPVAGGPGGATSLSERARQRRAAMPLVPGLRIRSAPSSLPLGRSAGLVVELTGPRFDRSTWKLTLRPPAAAGLSVEPPAARTLMLEAGASEIVAFTVRADRPDALNGGEPWVIDVRAASSGYEETAAVAIAVPDPGLARSADSLDFTDETSPALRAWTAAEPCAADLAQRRLRFPVRLLGRGIRVDAAHPIDVTVEAPETLEASAIARMSIVQGGRVLGTGTAMVPFTLTDRDTPVELEVELTSHGTSAVEARWSAAGEPPLRERGEDSRPDLFRLREPRPGGSPGSYRISPDVVRLLLNPVAGHGEPLGRRMHPLSGLGVGASLTAAFGVAAEPPPTAPGRARAAALWIRWLAVPDLDFDLEARAEVASITQGCPTVRVELLDAWRRLASESEIVVVPDASLETPGAAAALLARRHIQRPPTSQRPAAATPRGRPRARLLELWQRLMARAATGGQGTPES